jgi:4'-phosphopantetheinyl transferase EntD
MERPLADEICHAVWRDILPGSVRFSAGFEPPVDDLTRQETESLSGAGARRRREFAAGRWHARRALRELGVQEPSIPRGDDGAPIWPEGFVGSISHTMDGERVFAVAAVARVCDLLAVGIDVEAPARPPARVWEGVLTRAEMAQVMSLPAPLRTAEVMAYWCAKEAVAKACMGRFGIESIGIHRESGSPTFDARIVAARDVVETARVFTGKTAWHAGWTFAAALRDVHGSLADGVSSVT